MEIKHTINCVNCGADLEFKPGTHSLECEYCGTTNEIPKEEFEIKELNLKEYLNLDKKHKKFTAEVITCPGCGAKETLAADKSSSFCAYCGTPLVSGKIQSEEILSPDYLLPFKLDQKQALERTSGWLRGNWFVPSKLKKTAISYDHFKGVYLPFWTYDADTFTYFTGQRGDTYYQEVRRGDKVHRVAKTRWSRPFQGQIQHFFNDVLITATTSLDQRYLDKLSPWDLHNLVPFKEDYLRGFITEKFHIGLREGFKIARERMQSSITQMIRRRIGGDKQRIINQQSQFNNLTFKHILLPVYVSSFKYKGKKYQFIVNSRTGEVQGQRPLSPGKIALVVIGVLLLLTLFYYLSQRSPVTILPCNQWVNITLYIVTLQVIVYESKYKLRQSGTHLYLFKPER